MRRDLVFGTNVSQLYASQAITGSEASSSANKSDNTAVKFIIDALAVTTDIILKLQESVDDSVWTDVDASEVVSDSALIAGQLTIPATGGDNTSSQMGYVGFEQYSRVFVVSGGGVIGVIGEVAPNFYEDVN